MRFGKRNAIMQKSIIFVILNTIAKIICAYLFKKILPAENVVFWKVWFNVTEMVKI